MPELLLRNRKIHLGKKALLMGVLNATPDSFSDGGIFQTQRSAVDHCIAMIKNGADIIDIGGESTRPGSNPVSAKEELSRVIPIISELKNINPECIISIDTQKPEVARKAVESGADIINDVSGLQYSTDIASIAAETKAGLVLMHMKGTPENMQKNIKYTNLLHDIKAFLLNSVETAKNLGVNSNQIVIDPGIGFGKTLEHNLKILANINFFKDAGYPLLVGPSRKAFIGSLLNETDPQKRTWGTGGAIAYLASENVDIVRVHDVREIKQLLTVFEAIKLHKHKTIN